MEQGYNKYKVTLKHDTGKKVLIVTAINEYSAQMLVMACEGCPKSAIASIKQVQ